MNNQRVFLIFVLCLLSQTTFARIIEGQAAERLIPGTVLIEFNDQNDLIKRINFNASKPLKAEGIDSWLLKFNQDFFPTTTFKFLKKETDKLGFTHLFYEQYYQDHKVEYAILKIHLKQGMVYQLNAELYSSLNEINFTASDKIDAEKAKVIAKNHFLDQQVNDLNIEINVKGQLFYPMKNNQLTPCFKIDIYAHSPQPKRSYLYISTQDGKILFEEDRIEHSNVTGTAVTMYCGTRQITTDSINPTTFYLRETGARNIHTWDLNTGTSYGSAVEFVDNNNYWNTITNHDDAAYDAHFGSEMTYDYYNLIHGRNSYDNAGTTINSYVHYSVGYVNAFWDGTQMTYGDGDGSNYGPLTSTDVVGHEITHAVTEHTAGLIYSSESGALNESFSDIFGVTIDYYANPLTANFLMGDEFALTGVPFRDMTNPNAFNHPDTYGGLYWFANGDVHTNSGVQNYWYYLICSGGSGTNDLGNTFNITSIGMTAAAAIAFRTLTVYLTPSSPYTDARTYSIQSAIDLYGACSNEVIQVTNAWYAVGVGSLFSNAINANFIADDVYFCSTPATVNFTNLSINASTYTWHFGDGTSSNLANPAHTYTSTGNYTVTLIITGTALCSAGGIDTLTLPNYITITNLPVPIAASCTPISGATTNSYGITKVTLNTLINTSLPATEGYKDFTCLAGTTLTTATQYLFKVNTPSTTNYVKAWIDYNNDGAFTNPEQIASFSTGNTINQATIAIPPSGVVLNTPLRLRVLSNSSAITSACQNPTNGQAEDYKVIIETGSLPPIANFMMSDSVILLGGSVNFTDLSTNTPTTWAWTINGGTPNNSVIQNPTAIFSTLGTYNIRLIVSSSYGSDTMIKTLGVVSQVNLCSPLASQTTSGTSGILYDSGGPSGNYQNSQNCSLLISPGNCTDSIRLTFSAFNTESGYDYFRVYDGTSTSGTLLLNVSGTSIPPSVKATSGNMFIQWNTDGSVTRPGFAANWQAYQHPLSPTLANFSFSPNNPPLLDTVFFQDLSSNNTNAWYWDFGDGNTSTLENPMHQYSLSGTYAVRLITSSCGGGNDTITQNITVQASPNVVFNPTAYSISLGCNDTITLPLYIQNTNGGTLNWNVLNQNYSNSAPNLLVWTYGVDMGATGEYTNTMAAINQYVSNYTFTTTATTDPLVMQTLLQGKTTLLIPEKETGSLGLVTPFTSVIQTFVQNGGNVIICGDYNIQTWKNIGIFTGNNGNYVTSGVNFPVVNATTPLTNNLGSTVQSQNAVYFYQITNANKTTVISYTTGGITYDVVTTMPYGQGRATYIAYDYYQFNNDAAHIISNAVEWVNSSASNGNLTVNPLSGTTPSGATDTTYLQVNSNGMSGGLDTLYLVIQTNDLSNPIDSIPLYLNISMMPCVNFGKTLLNLCTGIVNFVDSTNNAPTSWLWRFGDGTTSTLQHPSHTYTTVGTFNVTLIASNATGTDSFTKALIIPYVGGPINASCTPVTGAATSTYGITKVEFNTINNTTLPATEGYKDFTCSQATTLYVGNQYLLKVNTPSTSNYVKAWIDYNNDGAFTNPEEIASFTTGNTAYQTVVTLPPSGISLNTHMRLRVLSNNTTITSACQNPTNGQAEDYTVFIPAALSSPTPTICNGGAATITFNVGAGAYNYTWQQSTNGGSSWYIVSGANNASTSIVATLNATRLFRVIYTSPIFGLDTTPVFTLTVVPDPTVALSASNNNFCAGTVGTTLTATLNGGFGTGIYQWQQYIGSVWTNIAGATNATYTTPSISANTNYKVISSQTGLGCGTTGANTINIIVKPLPGIYTNPASATICTGGSVTVNAYNATTYSWYPPTGLNTTTGTPVVASPTATTNYSLTGVGTNGCAKTIWVPITVNPDPSVGITGDTTVCSGGSLTLTAVSGGGIGTCTRQWQSSVNGTTWSNIAGATGTTYTTPAITATTYYRVTFTCNGNGCSPAATSAAHKIHIFNNALTTVGATTLCVDGSVQLLAPTMGGTYQCSWTWQSSPNGTTWTTIPNANMTFYYPPTTTASNIYYRANTNCIGASCTNVPTDAILITVNPDPSVTITGQNSICGSGSTVLTANPLGGTGTSTYQWQENIAGVYTAIAGATAMNYTTPILTSPKTYRVSHAATGAGCGLANSPNYGITILPLPSIYASPATPTICTGGSVTVNAYNGTNFSWSPPTGLNTTTGTPVIASPTATTTYSLTGVGTNGCSKTISVPVTVNPDPSIIVTGDTTICSGGNLTLTSTSAGGAGTCTRQWQTSANGTTWNNIPGATGTTYSTPALSTTTYYRVTYTCTGFGCSPAASSNAHKIHIFNNVLTSVGSNTLCVGGTVKLQAPTMGGSYQCTWAWESSPNGSTWTTIPNATLTYYYPPTNTVGNTYYRAITNCVGAYCANTATTGIMVTVNADPSITVSGQNSICGSGSTVLTANPLGGTGTSTYQWQENIAGVFTPIAGATALTYTSPILTATKTYRVSHSATGSGCGLANSPNYGISILPLPGIYTNPASPSFCIGGTSTITAYSGTSYSWSPATGLSATTGSPVTASPTASITYSLTGLGTNGCSKTISVPVTVTSDPSISITGPSTVPTGTSATLTATTSGGSGTCTRQWQSSTNGTTWTNVAGATAATYSTPAIVGTKYYRATYTCNGSGCSPAATSNVLAITGIQPPVRLAEKVYDLNLYPNPASVNVMVSLSVSEDEKSVFMISDMLGKILMQWDGMPVDGVYEHEVSIEGLSQGVYLLSVKIGDRVMTQKFVKE